MYAICDKCRHIFKIKKRKRIYRECQNCRSTKVEYITNIQAQRMLEKGKSTIPTKSTKPTEKKKSKKRSFDIEQIKEDFKRWYSTMNQMEKYEIRTDITKTMRWLSRYKLLYEDQQEVAKSIYADPCML